MITLAYIYNLSFWFGYTWINAICESFSQVIFNTWSVWETLKGFHSVVFISKIQFVFLFTTDFCICKLKLITRVVFLWLLGTMLLWIFMSSFVCILLVIWWNRITLKAYILMVGILSSSRAINIFKKLHCFTFLPTKYEILISAHPHWIIYSYVMHLTVWI